MSDPLADLLEEGNEYFNEFVAEISGLDRAFQTGALGEFINSRSSSNDGDTGELAGEAGEDVLGGEDRGESRESEAGEETV